jgi:hypothetical protein
MSYGAPTYTKEQNAMYNKLLVGRNAFSKEEWYNLNSKKKKQVITRYKKAQQILNRFKELRSIAYLKDRIATMIPNLKLIRIECIDNEDVKVNTFLGDLFNDDTIIEDHINKFKLKDLKIRKEQIVELWMNNGLLPANFNELE